MRVRSLFPIAVSFIGLVLMLGGLVWLSLRLLAPENLPLTLGQTPTVTPPRPASLLATPLAPPEALSADIPILPEMPVAVRVAQVPTPPLQILPSPTPSRTSTIPFSHTPSHTPILPPILASTTPSPSPSPSSPPSTPSHTLALPPILASPTPSPSPSPSPPAPRQFEPRDPARLLIPDLNLDAPIRPVWLQRIESGGQVYSQWRVPAGRTVGWHNTSARLGESGNLVLNGHHNSEGHVFKDLIKIQVGAQIRLEGADGEGLNYTVVQTLLLQEAGRSLEERQANARWLLPSHDERITLVTCWPPDGNSHRFIVLALPTDKLEQSP